MWSWSLTLLGLLAMWLVPKRPALGWSVGIFSEVVWMAYAITTDQLGFIIGAVAYGVVYTRNLRKSLALPTQGAYHALREGEPNG